MNFQQPPQYHITPSSGYTSLDFDGDKLEITPLGSGNEVGRSAILVQFKGKTVMVCQAQSFFFAHSTTSIIVQTDTAILFFRVGFQFFSPQLFCCVLLGGVKLFFVLVSAFVRWVKRLMIGPCRLADSPVIFPLCAHYYDTIIFYDQ